MNSHSLQRVLEMTDICNPELERNGDVSSSDDDSVSLLHEMNDCQNGATAKDTEREESDSQNVNKEQNKSLEIIPPMLLEEQMSGSIQSKSASVLPCLAMNKKFLEKRNERGESRLHKACRRKDVAQVKGLIQAGISVNMEDYAGWTPLHEASAQGDKAVVEELLKAGAHVNVRGFNGFTPLHDAVSSGHYQVVKLLLQYGSNASDRNLHGLTALDMAENNIKDLLSSFPLLSESRESDDKDEPGDVQLRNTRTDTLRLSQAVEVVLKRMERDQRRMLTLTNPQDAGKYHSSLTQIQNKVLISQHLEMDNIAQRYRSVSGLQQRILKSQLVSLASRQRNLMEILQKQLDVVEAYVTTKTQLTSQSSKHQNSTAVKRPSDHSYTRASTKPREAPGSCQDNQSRTRRKTAAPSLTQTNSCRGSTTQPGNTLQHSNFQIKGRRALIQTQCDDNSRHLSTLVQRGVMPPGSVLELLLKGQWHRALVSKDGSIKDTKGKLHVTPQRWLESILGNNIPVSSVYAWDKVLFRDKSLSYYLFNMEAEVNTAQPPAEGGVQHCTAASSQDTLSTGRAGLNCLMRVKIIHLVDDELLPNAVCDYHWEKLLKNDYSELEDW
ncbi:ankyrin repeat domain-containing protein 31 isoform X1 [Solea senegalensis]|uniref:Ankyrin repeat domain-containing protein 31 isoform X1 n=2 Tax=Solea senegalensis TaxID=28829 RepID=A0AAV6PKU1_SOLSE|nr:ankyrin repeat domain-containing protein 31-like isoform X1 [Solea senegalensis]KAG7468927.1 ankyrin repeat domain-containing protein 31 isoform X1 [Solea senegalensis]